MKKKKNYKSIALLWVVTVPVIVYLIATNLNLSKNLEDPRPLSVTGIIIIVTEVVTSFTFTPANEQDSKLDKSPKSM